MVSFAGVTVELGLKTDQVGLGKKGLYAVICFFIAICFVFFFELYLIMSKENQKKRPVPVGITKGRKLTFSIISFCLSYRKGPFFLMMPFSSGFLNFIFCSRNSNGATWTSDSSLVRACNAI